MSKTTFHQLTAFLLQTLAPIALHPASVLGGRLPPRRGIVLPAVLLTLRLRNIRSGVEFLTLGQGLCFVVALVGDGFFDLLLTTRSHQVGLSVQHTRHHSGR